jgi:hypothetical protein
MDCNVFVYLLLLPRSTFTVRFYFMRRLGYSKMVVDPGVRMVYRPPPNREWLHSASSTLPEMLTWAHISSKSQEQVRYCNLQAPTPHGL